MPKFTFICEHESAFTGKPLSKVTVECNRDRLDHVLEDIEDFLAGCGYVIDGDLQIVDSEEEKFDFTTMTSTVSDDFFADTNISITTSDDTITITDSIHNDFYYDINRNR